MSQERAKAYSEAGVNIEAGNSLVPKFKEIVATTLKDGVIGGIGGFGGLFQPDISGMKSPVLVSSTDGVGTKLKLASKFGMHSTVGIDLVAMSVNDILVQGAKPLFFLDYFATGELNPELVTCVVSGIAEGCRQSGCVLLGGETAEMPSMYAPGDYDLAGFAVGIVDKDRIVDGHLVSCGDAVIGLRSTGIHSNGYSLVRKIFDASGKDGKDQFPNLIGKTFADVLLTPTKIYVDAVLSLFDKFTIKGMAHITGGGFFDNIPRILPDGTCAKINFASWEIPPVFEWIKSAGSLEWDEMLQIFNCGIGYVIIVDSTSADAIICDINARCGDGFATHIGNICQLPNAGEKVEFVYPK